VVQGDALLADTSNTFIHTRSRLVGAVGVSNLIVVETADAVLVADRSQSQNVKKLVMDSRYFRPTEVETLLGDPSKAKLDRIPEIAVQQMCAEMVATDLEEAKKHCYNLNVSVE
jgi:GDP-D-mannose dehydratase